jgi:hypothetical protein
MLSEISGRWSAPQVRDRLLAMGDTLRAWRPHERMTPAGYVSAFPYPITSAGELFAAQVEQVALAAEEYAAVDLRPTQAQLIDAAYGEECPRPEQPSARAIDEMTEALRWFVHIVHPYPKKTALMRKVVWEWALRRDRNGAPLPPTAIGRRFNLSRETVRDWIDRACAIIAARLNCSTAT